MDRWHGQVVVVTGASAGIGEDICTRLVEENLQVFGFARRVEKIEDLSAKLGNRPGKLHAVKCDVTSKDEVTEAFKWVQENYGPVHILINNAGLYKQGTIIDGDVEDWRTVLETNVLGYTLCAQHAIQQMRTHNIQGHIINVNSVAGHMAVAGTPPVLNIYSPSKFAVTSLSEVLRQEIQFYKLKIKVTSISPGIVDTDIFKTAGHEDKIEDWPHLVTRDITDAVIYILSTGPNVQVQELILAALGAYKKIEDTEGIREDIEINVLNDSQLLET